MGRVTLVSLCILHSRLRQGIGIGIEPIQFVDGHKFLQQSLYVNSPFSTLAV